MIFPISVLSMVVLALGGNAVEMTCIAGHVEVGPPVSQVEPDNSCFVPPYKLITADKVFDIRRKGEVLPLAGIQKITLLQLQTRADLKDKVLWLATTGHSTRQDAAFCARLKSAGFAHVKIPRGGIAAIVRQLDAGIPVAELIALDNIQGYQALANDDVMLLVIGADSKSLRKLAPVGAVFIDNAAALNDWLTEAKLSPESKDFKFLVLVPSELAYIKRDFSNLNNIYFLSGYPADFFSFVTKMQQSVAARYEKGYVPCAVPQS